MKSSLGGTGLQIRARRKAIPGRSTSITQRGSTTSSAIWRVNARAAHRGTPTGSIQPDPFDTARPRDDGGRSLRCYSLPAVVTACASTTSPVRHSRHEDDVDHVLSLSQAPAALTSTRVPPSGLPITEHRGVARGSSRCRQSAALRARIRQRKRYAAARRGLRLRCVIPNAPSLRLDVRSSSIVPHPRRSQHSLPNRSSIRAQLRLRASRVERFVIAPTARPTLSARAPGYRRRRGTPVPGRGIGRSARAETTKPSYNNAIRDLARSPAPPGSRAGNGSNA